jgi:predicted DNA-binding transcriptional regulator AlpA
VTGEVEQLVQVPQAAKLLGFSIRKVWEKLADGTFKRVKHPDVERTCLLMSEIQAYIRRISRQGQ